MTNALQNTRLFGRSVRLVIGAPTDPTVQVQADFNQKNTSGLDISGMSIAFVIEKSLVPTEPNTASIKVRNLAQNSREMLSKASSLTVLLEAGYQGATAQLYFAGARAAYTTREGADYVTHIESSDTIARPKTLKATKKIPPGSTTGSIYRTTGARIPVTQAFKTLSDSLGIKFGNAALALANSNMAVTAVNGSALLGNSARRMTDLCRSAGLEWSIQDGELQLLAVGQALSTVKAIEVNSQTGLINSPAVDSQGALEIETLLIPGLAPGVLIKVDSLFVQGGFRIEKIRYEGNTHGQEWYARMAAAKY